METNDDANDGTVESHRILHNRDFPFVTKLLLFYYFTMLPFGVFKRILYNFVVHNLNTSYIWYLEHQTLEKETMLEGAEEMQIESVWRRCT